VPVKEETVLVRRGEAVRLGWLSCQVDTLIRSPWAGDRYVRTWAEGTFWILKLTFGNNSAEDQILDLGYFRLSTPDDQSFAPRFDLAIYYGDAGLDRREKLKPGQRFTGYLIFDLPQEITEAHLRLSNVQFVLE
jgi:hypothetical protein